MNQLIEMESTFHDRAALVIRDILAQVGFDSNKLRMITQLAGTLSFLPAIGPLAQLQGLLKDIEPLMLMAQEHDDPAYYLKAVPEEKILYFINQVITRLEWVKNGNEETTNESEVDHAEGGYTSE